MNIERKHIINGGFLVGAVAGANFLNFLFNAILGRWLSFEDFGLVTLIITFYSVTSLFTNSLAGVINFSVSKFSGADTENQQLPFLKTTLRKSTVFLCVAVVVWCISMPLLMSVFHVPTYVPLLAFIPVFIASMYAYPIIGYFQGKLEFLFAGILIVCEALIKLVVGLLFPILHLNSYSYLSIPVSLIVVSLVAWILLKNKIRGLAAVTHVQYSFPTKYYLTSIAVGVGSTLFFSVDILLVRHFFSSELSGQYALVSLIGKMVFFLSVLPNMFTLPVVARTSDKKRIKKLFMVLIAATFSLSLVAWIALGGFGSVLVPMLFGEKSLVILPLLPMYTLGVGLYVLSSVIVTFHLAQQNYAFSYPLITAGIVVGILILLRHHSLTEITTNITATCALLLSFLVVMHFYNLRKEMIHAQVIS